ncbi:MAG: hypothetical protein AAF709_24675, partial [Pseudomonadota bacterium]
MQSLESRYLKYEVFNAAHGLEQGRIAAKIVCTEAQLTQWLNGEIRPRRGTLLKFASFIFTDLSKRRNDPAYNEAEAEFISAAKFLRRCDDGEISVEADPPTRALKFLIATGILSKEGKLFADPGKGDHAPSSAEAKEALDTLVAPNELGSLSSIAASQDHPHLDLPASRKAPAIEILECLDCDPLVTVSEDKVGLAQVGDPELEFELLFNVAFNHVTGEIDGTDTLLGLLEARCRVETNGCTVEKCYEFGSTNPAFRADYASSEDAWAILG